MDLYHFLLYGFQSFATFFVLGLAYAILEREDDDSDDDDRDGGILQPCYVKQ